MTLRKTIPTAAKRKRRKTAANRLSEIPTPRGKMIPSPVTPSPRQPPSDLRAARDLPPRFLTQRPVSHGGPLISSRHDGGRHDKLRRRSLAPACRKRRGGVPALSLERTE